jgi:class 3 adenylate cyclase
MSLADDIRTQVRDIFSKQWDTRDGTVVPDNVDVALGNVAVKLEATVLYADLAESTAMVKTQKAHFAAEIYKAYLIAACRVIRSNGGEITAFDGDRVMAVFLGGSKNTSAAKTALQINWAVNKIVNEELARQYQGSSFRVVQAVGIDTSELWVARTGIRGSNDLVWVGRAANYAAKLCSLRAESNVSWITDDVYNMIKDSAKYSNGRSIWERRKWNEYNCDVYSSNWWWSIE